MAWSWKRKSDPAQDEANTASLVLRFRNRQDGDPELSPVGRKRHRSDNEDDVSATSSDESTDLELEALESDPESDSSGNAPSAWLRPSVLLQSVAQLLADWVYPHLSRWMESARYIRPPECRLRPRKRPKRLNEKPRSILMETEDPDDPSTVLIQRVDGYFDLACPIYVSDPDHNEACVLEHGIRSIPDLFRHLRKCHPSSFYCPVCGEIFGSDIPCDNHIRARTCTLRSFTIKRGVSGAQLRRAVRGDDRRRHEADRWRRIYAQVLPETARPRRSVAYLSQGLPLAVSMARDYWDSRGRGLTEQYLAEQGLSGDGEFAGEDLSTLYDLTGRELIKRVVVSAQSGQLSPRTPGDEAGWEFMKAERE